MLCGEAPLGFASQNALTYRTHIVGRELGLTVSSATRLTPTIQHVACVVLKRSDPEMRWVAAETGVARMKDEEALRYGAAAQFVGKPVGSNDASAGDPNAPVAIRFCCSGPEPTVTSAVHPAPEALRDWDQMVAAVCVVLASQRAKAGAFYPRRK